MRLHASHPTHRLLGILAVLILLATHTYGADRKRNDSIYAEFGIEALSSSGEYAPFWMHSAHNERISHRPHSGSVFAKIGKDMTNDHLLLDYGFGIAAQGGIDTKGWNYIVPELYATGRFYIFDATIGIMAQQYGNEDKDLSSGGLLFSKNARPMPRATIGISEYRNVPFTFGYLQIKGGISHAWFADNVYVQGAYLHHKFIGGKIGGDLPVNLSYEFQHAAQWGGISPVYGDLGNTFEGFWNALLAKAGGSMANDQINAQGNHIGSQHVGLDIKIKNWELNAYWQMIFEDGPIRFIGTSMNAPDGLWGVVLQNHNFPYVNKIVYEYVNTTDQSGPFHDKDGIVYGGSDNYFNNGIYKNGWNYYYRTIGTPFITSPIYNSDGAIQTRHNRIQTHYVALMGDIYGYKYKARVSHTKSYGTYSGPLDMHTTSASVEVTKHFEKLWGLHFGVTIGGDFGTQFGNSVGVAMSVKKRIEILN